MCDGLGMVPIGVYAVPNEDENERDALKPYSNGLVLGEPVKKCIARDGRL